MSHTHSVTVVSIVRLQSLVSFANSDNPTWDNLRVSQWSTIEVNVGIICACMPTLRLILLRVFPALSSTVRNYGGHSGSFGDKYGPSAAGSRSNRSQARGGADVESGLGGGMGGGSGGGVGGPKRVVRPGITYQRSYTVHFDDVETSSQVHLKDLDSKGLEAASSECSA